MPVGWHRACATFRPGGAHRPRRARCADARRLDRDHAVASGRLCHRMGRSPAGARVRTRRCVALGRQGSDRLADRGGHRARLRDATEGSCPAPGPRRGRTARAAVPRACHLAGQAARSARHRPSRAGAAQPRDAGLPSGLRRAAARQLRRRHAGRRARGRARGPQAAALRPHRNGRPRVAAVRGHRAGRAAHARCTRQASRRRRFRSLVGVERRRRPGVGGRARRRARDALRTLRAAALVRVVRAGAAGGSGHRRGLSRRCSSGIATTRPSSC